MRGNAHVVVFSIQYVMAIEKSGFNMIQCNVVIMLLANHSLDTKSGSDPNRSQWPLAMVISVVVGSRSAPKLEAAKQGFHRLATDTVEVQGVPKRSKWIFNARNMLRTCQ